MPITYDRDAVYAAVRGPVFGGRLSASQEAGIDAILTEWERLQPDGDIRFVAYMLATAAWETAHTMRPIEEYGHGRGRAYGHPTGPWHLVYDGRGDVQLTWIQNYARATTRLRQLGVLRADEDLVEHPELALRPDVAAAIMLYGMVEGWFTGKRLADYFNGVATDWPGARHIINGIDHAAQIGAFGEHFFAGLKAGLTKTAAQPARPPAPAPAAPAPASAPVVSAPPTPAPAPTATPAPSLLSRLTSLFGR